MIAGEFACAVLYNWCIGGANYCKYVCMYVHMYGIVLESNKKANFYALLD